MWYTSQVYERAHATDDTRLGRLRRLYRCGAFAGPLFCCVAAVHYMYWRWLEAWLPAKDVDPAPDYVPMESDRVPSASASRSEAQRRR